MFVDDSVSTSTIDLSVAPRLRDVTFWAVSSSIEWITVALETVTQKVQGLQRITIHLYDSKIETSGPGVWGTAEERIREQWRSLDHLLVQLWESHSIRPRVEGSSLRDEREVRDVFWGFLPEITKRGIVDIVIPSLTVSTATVTTRHY